MQEIPLREEIFRMDGIYTRSTDFEINVRDDVPA